MTKYKIQEVSISEWDDKSLSWKNSIEFDVRELRNEYMPDIVTVVGIVGLCLSSMVAILSLYYSLMDSLMISLPFFMMGAFVIGWFQSMRPIMVYVYRLPTRKAAELYIKGLVK